MRTLETKQLTATDTQIIPLLAALDSSDMEGWTGQRVQSIGQGDDIHHHGQEVRHEADWRVEALGLDRTLCQRHDTIC